MRFQRIHEWFPVLGRSALAAALCLTVSSAVLGQDDRAVHLQTFDKVWTLVRDTHFDPELGGLDWQKVRDELRPRAEKASSKAALRGILNEMLGRLGQSHFSVIPGGGSAAPESERKLTPPGQQTWDSGLGFAVHLVEGEPRVAAVTPGSAVARAGVQVGWRIVRVGETPVPARCETTCEVNFPLLKASGEEVVVEFRGPGSEAREVGLPLEARRSRLYEFEGMPAQNVWIEEIGRASCRERV